jgi:hypothetical protein
MWSVMAQKEPNLDVWAERRPRGTAVVIFEPRIREAGRPAAAGGPSAVPPAG